MTPGPTALPPSVVEAGARPIMLLALGRVHRHLGGRGRAPRRRVPDLGRRAHLRRVRARARCPRPSPTSPRPASGSWWRRAATSATAGRGDLRRTTASSPPPRGRVGLADRPRRPWPRRSARARHRGGVRHPERDVHGRRCPTCPRCGRRRATGSWWPTRSRASASSTCRWTSWGIDVVVSGSQKGLMTPPGLAFVAANARAVDALRRPRRRRLLPRLGAHPQGRLAQPVHPAGHDRVPAPGGAAADRRRGPAERLRPPPGARPRHARRRPGDGPRPAGTREPGGQRGHRLPHPGGRGREGRPEADEVAVRASRSPAARASCPARSAGSATAATTTSGTS